MKDTDEQFIQILPKPELHLHLEGSISPETLLHLADKYGTRLSGESAAYIRETLFSYADFPAFLNTYRKVCKHLRSAEDYLLLLNNLEAYLVRENILYAEILYTPSIPWFFEKPGDEFLEALLERSRQFERESGIKTRWILDCVRQFGPELAERTAELARQHRESGVVAVGIGGDERSIPLKEFEEVFGWVRAHQLYIHVHAGEIGEPEEIWDALQLLGANRIGHGIQAARDPKLMTCLKNRAVALDICLTSNTKTRAWHLNAEHPFGLLYRRGVPVTLNTDDPGLFDTTLCLEYKKAVEFFELTKSDLQYLVLQAANASFLPYAEKMVLMQSIRDKMQAIDTEIDAAPREEN